MKIKFDIGNTEKVLKNSKSAWKQQRALKILDYGKFTVFTFSLKGIGIPEPRYMYLTTDTPLETIRRPARRINWVLGQQ